MDYAELFAGVGGFRLVLEGYRSDSHPELNPESAGPYRIVWANQWQPLGFEAKKLAWRNCEHRSGEGSCVNDDINKALDKHEDGTRKTPGLRFARWRVSLIRVFRYKHFPKAGGIEGKNGIPQVFPKAWTNIGMTDRHRALCMGNALVV